MIIIFDNEMSLLINVKKYIYTNTMLHEERTKRILDLRKICFPTIFNPTLGTPPLYLIIEKRICLENNMKLTHMI